MRVKTLTKIPSTKGIIPAGQAIEIPDTMFGRLKGKVIAIFPEREINTTVIWSNPYQQGTPEAREESLQQIMTAIWESTFDRVKVVWPRGFVSTPEIRAAEIEIERVRSLVLSGKAKLADFQQAIEAWKGSLSKE